MQRNLAALAVCLVLFLIPAVAESVTLSIDRTPDSIELDGVLGEHEWRDALRIETFYEHFRTDNEPPPVPTVALLAYDDRYLYVAFDAGDPDARRIRAPFVDRDAVLADQDWVGIVLDPGNTRRSGMILRVNPRGVLADSMRSDGSDDDYSPDFHYDAITRVHERGWVAEMRVPLTSLRYSREEGRAPSFGVMLLRNYPRDFRYVMSSAPVPKSSNCFICHVSELAGFEELPSPNSWSATPYVTSSVDSKLRDPADPASGLDGGTFASDLGVDLEWTPTSSVRVDATWNPDFSQVESDVARIDLNNRFALLYPEKRTFFLEGVDLLSTPISAVQTRSITSPSWGLRATGQQGSAAWTLLVAEDEGGGTLLLPGTLSSRFAPQDFSSLAVIGRLRYTLGNSALGFLATAREIDGGGHNRVYGPDFEWRFNDGGDRLFGQLLLSDTRDTDRPDLDASFDGGSASGHGARLAWARRRASYDSWVEVLDFADGFRADNGFVPQAGYRGTWVEGGRRFHLSGPISFVRTYFSWYGETDRDGNTTRSQVYPGIYFQGKWNSEGWIDYRFRQRERVGSTMLDAAATGFYFAAAPLRHLPRISIQGVVGDRIDFAHGRLGTGASLTAEATVRPHDRVELALLAENQWIDLDGGRLFDARVERLRLGYAFSSRSFARVIAQHEDIRRNPDLWTAPVDDREGGVSISALYAWKLNFQTVFFIGYGDSGMLDPRDEIRSTDRSLFMKVSYAIRR